MTLEPEEIYDGILSGEITVAEFKAWLVNAGPVTAEAGATGASANGVLSEVAEGPQVVTLTLVAGGSGLGKAHDLED
jgi:hypothetical protein